VTGTAELRNQLISDRRSTMFVKIVFAIVFAGLFPAEVKTAADRVETKLTIPDHGH